MTDENKVTNEAEKQIFMQTLGIMDMIYESQFSALAGLSRGSYKEMEEGIKKAETLRELLDRGIPMRR